MKGRLALCPSSLGAIALALASLNACTAPSLGSGSGTLEASPVAEATLTLFGSFEAVDLAEARITSADALQRARDQEFGRPGLPEASLLRYQGTGSDLVSMPQGKVVWVFHWANLKEEEYKAFPNAGESGKPNETVFIRNDYFLFVDASDGDVIAGVLL